MTYLLLILVASVFLGTEIIAVPTPFAQLTIYRVCALSVIPLIGYFMIQKNRHLTLKNNDYSSFAVAIYIFWWLWAFISLLWVQDVVRWLQSMFLLTLGISSILALYLWTDTFKTWKLLLKGAWTTMTFTVLMGFYEIITNHYILADVEKLDKYNTFISEPLTRLPATVFENQNDFGVMLIAYVAVTLILFYTTSHIFKRFTLLFFGLAGIYLIYRTQSRMAMLSLLIYMVVALALNFKIDFKRKHYIIGITFVLALITLAVLFVPEVSELLLSILVPKDTDYLSGDAARINLIRNGLIYLALTLGMGVGAGNIETWMENVPIFNTNNLVNIHNWWAEILVGFGLIIFLLYVTLYILLIYRLFHIRKVQNRHGKNITNQLIAFLTAFIFASMTSSSNMLIEWHWVFFGLIIAYVKINEQTIPIFSQTKRRKQHEFNYNFK